MEFPFWSHVKETQRRGPRPLREVPGPSSAHQFPGLCLGGRLKQLQGEKWWTRDDNATATLGQDGSLTIRSSELVVKEEVAKKLERAPTLEGF